MPTRTRSLALLVAALALAVPALAACSGPDGTKGAAAVTTTTAADRSSDDEDNEVNTLHIDMQDEHFAIAGNLKAGTTTIGLRNSGSEVHMAAFFRLKPGKTVSDAAAAFTSGDSAAVDAVVDGKVDAPGGVLSPGQSEEVTTDFLAAGSYVVACFVPTAGEAQPVPHVAKGMIAGFEVAPGNVTATAPRSDAVYTVSDGHVDGPTSLKEGRLTLRFNSRGKSPHQFFVIKKRTPATTYEDVDAFFSGLFQGTAAPPKGYTEAAPGVLTASTFDVAAGDAVFVTAQLTPGEYLIGCARRPDDSEGPSAKPHTGELLTVTVT
ncbi:MAG TPA: hypothetical protein VFJ85_13965 [Acidimicrobiales bacterium]|nr:hypothetical protein [Acidimicrobiales bacterium]